MAFFLLTNKSALEGSSGVDYGGDCRDDGDGCGGDDGDNDENGGDDGDDDENGGGDGDDGGGWDWNHPVKTQAGNGVTLCGD